MISNKKHFFNPFLIICKGFFSDIHYLFIRKEIISNRTFIQIGIKYITPLLSEEFHNLKYSGGFACLGTTVQVTEKMDNPFQNETYGHFIKLCQLK